MSANVPLLNSQRRDSLVSEAGVVKVNLLVSLDEGGENGVKGAEAVLVI